MKTFLLGLLLGAALGMSVPPDHYPIVKLGVDMMPCADTVSVAVTWEPGGTGLQRKAFLTSDTAACSVMIAAEADTTAHAFLNIVYRRH